MILPGNKTAVYENKTFHFQLKELVLGLVKYLQIYYQICRGKSNVKPFFQMRLVFHCVDLNSINLLSFNEHFYQLEVDFIKRLCQDTFWLSDT